MRRIFATLLLSLVVTLMAAIPALASDAGGPCSDAHPGNSGYARNHITVLAHAGMLGSEHKPGEHHGYAGLCGVHA